MLQVFKFIFSSVFIFYYETLYVRRRTYYYASFVLGLLFFANFFVLLNIILIVFLGGASFYIDSPLFPWIGNGVVFLTLIIISSNKNYNVIILEIQSLPADKKKRLCVISKIYVTISILAFLILTLSNF